MRREGPVWRHVGKGRFISHDRAQATETATDRTLNVVRMYLIEAHPDLERNLLTYFAQARDRPILCRACG